MVVMSAQPHLGGAIRKALMRLLGTISGVTIAIATLWLFGDHNTAIIFTVICLACLVFAYIASSHDDISYAGTLGGVTVILVLTGQNVSIALALQRSLYIIIGVIIALVVSWLVFPIHARDRLRYHIATSLRNLRALYNLILQHHSSIVRKGTHKITQLNAVIIRDLAAQQQLIHEAVIGSKDVALHETGLQSILLSEQNLNRLLHALYLCEHAAVNELIEKNNKNIMLVHKDVAHSFQCLASCILQNEVPLHVFNYEKLMPTLASIADSMSPVLHGQQLLAVHSFLFLLEQFLQELTNLQNLIVKVHGKMQGSMVYSQP